MLPAQPLIGFGQVRHTRLRPTRHAFAYPTFFLMLPLRAMLQHGSGALACNRAGWISFHDADHGDGRSAQQGGALGWLDDILEAQGILDATGEIWLHCYARVLGYTFKPVSFWYCERADGALRAIVVEVNNTFGERHCYVLDAPRYGQTLLADKVFHVSPFCRVEGQYRFRFMRTEHNGQSRTVARVELGDERGPLLQTSVSGMLETVSPQAIRKAIWRHPLMTVGLMVHIHWQALRLWLKQVPFFSKPALPQDFVTRNHPTS